MGIRDALEKGLRPIITAQKSTTPADIRRDLLVYSVLRPPRSVALRGYFPPRKADQSPTMVASFFLRKADQSTTMVVAGGHKKENETRRILTYYCTSINIFGLIGYVL